MSLEQETLNIMVVKINGFTVFGTAKAVLYIEVSLFRIVLIEGFHCRVIYRKLLKFRRI